MGVEAWIDKVMPDIMGGLAQCWQCPVGVNTEKGLNLAGKQAVVQVLTDLIAILFPGCHGHEPVPAGRFQGYLHDKLKETALRLEGQVERALTYQSGETTVDPQDCARRAEETVTGLIGRLPEIQRALQADITAAYEGDPAAQSFMEIVMSYPGVYAIMVHRIAHPLYQGGTRLIARIMSESAHSLTGIDIHPGAQIGAGFFIDHGTGVVIGETCAIGSNVKLYQGVTLGALSFEKDEHGHLVKGVKRHPNVEDNVVIYAGATILGGQTTIGRDSVIGGNVWLTHSVPPGSKVYNQQPRPLIRQVDGRWHVAKGAWNDLGAGI